jgi:hypothetical protein
VARGLSAEALLGRPVLLRGIRLGLPTDVLFDADLTRAVGLEVHCGDEQDRFLPLPSARVADQSLEVESALHLLDPENLTFYRGLATSFRDVRGALVEQRGRGVGIVGDLILADDGAVIALIVDAGGRRRELRPGEGVAIRRSQGASAA